MTHRPEDYAARLAASVANHEPLEWLEYTDGSIRAEVCADNVVLCTLYVHKLGSGSYGVGHMWMVDGQSCSMGNDAPDVPAAKRDAIECAIACLDAARKTLTEALETQDAGGPSKPPPSPESGV
jgi:hypothetical protein